MDWAVILAVMGFGMTVFSALVWPSPGERSPGILPFVSIMGVIFFVLGILTGLVAVWKHFFKKTA